MRSRRNAVDGISEIVNYRKAMFQAEEMLKSLPVPHRVICQAH